MQIIFEIRTPSMEWVFLEKMHLEKIEEVVARLKSLKAVHPECLIKATDLD